MKIIGITACITGIAHTYIAKEKLVNAGKKLGHDIKIETQGSIGIEDELTKEDVQNADVVIIAADVGITGRERFKGKKVVEVQLSTVIKDPENLLKKIEKKISS